MGRRSRDKKNVVKVEEEQVIESPSKHAENGLRAPLPSRSLPSPRIFYGLNVDELTSDSDLTDVPDDIGPDPFEIAAEEITSNDVKTKKSKKDKSRKPGAKSRPPTQSPYFPSVPRHAHRPTFLATLPFPPLHHEKFGLMQERLAHVPFRLLLATIFLNKTPGSRAMPILYRLLDKYPTPRDLADAKQEDITEIIHQLGFQNQRARKCIAFAKGWIDNPPIKGRRYRKLNYPRKGDGRNIKEGEVLGDEDDEQENDEDEGDEEARQKVVAWEISHLPGLGPYSHDSWRMFCRDELRGLAEDWLGNGRSEAQHAPISELVAQGDDGGFEPEWKRVVPTDKELRAYLTWMWLKEGWLWDKETGERTKAPEDLMKLAEGGGVVREKVDENHLLVTALQDPEEVKVKAKDHGDVKVAGKIVVEKPAGDFMPS